VTTKTTSPETIAANVLVERHSDRLPRFVVIPSALVNAWQLQETTTVEGSINGVAFGRRSLKPWDSDRWFIELPELICRQAHIDVGNTVNVVVRLASVDLPAELASLVRTDAKASAAWSALTGSQQRMLREHVLAAKSTRVRLQRAYRGLGATPETNPHRP
jgi:hypothetical protein